MVILRRQNKITDFLTILAWASPFNLSIDSYPTSTWHEETQIHIDQLLHFGELTLNWTNTISLARVMNLRQKILAPPDLDNVYIMGSCSLTILKVKLCYGDVGLLVKISWSQKTAYPQCIYPQCIFTTILSLYYIYFIFVCFIWEILLTSNAQN